MNNELTVIDRPYDDDRLFFNEETQRYELTFAFLKNEYGSAYKDDNEAKRRIKLNSRVIYSYINIHTAEFNRHVVNFLLHKTEQGRQFLFELLNEQQYADMQTGYNDLMYNPAVSFGGSKDVDRNEIRRNTLCVGAEEVFQSSPRYFGFNIGYLGQYPPFVYLLAR